ncbi:DNA-binding transcriptional ArsR family regulator [Rhizobium skierniewicense]|uniref:DNA-binding transcriptional ArsR family regulator n=1 Tax=Rhizobium skierniewicense TaxID=984260 RepID=A0A7W6G3A9_9HYPH|nr:winged helix-turn-helix domain-containing protein [Rhizobium skierniewicense]MBB3947675.1 DNA-binding transcriptional ArsR family regulator [Rhizobium skierniewicense]
MTNFASGTSIAVVASLLGDPARANMLYALMGGRALTAGELARHAGVTAQTTSGHLSRLADAQLLTLEKQGRHRYYRLASPEVAQAIDALMVVASAGPKRHRPVGPKDDALRMARTCYDHMAGRLAVSIADALCEKAYVVLADGAALVTEEGQRFLCDFGVYLASGNVSRRPLCRTCLDWSERRMHLAGKLGTGLLDRLMALGWVVRMPETRALRVTQAAETGLRATFGLSADWRVASPNEIKNDG